MKTLKSTAPLDTLLQYANRIRDKLVPLRKMEIDGIKFYYSKGNEPQDPNQMGTAREMHATLDSLSGETAIDVGAHIGSYALRMAKRFQHVIAFEPNPFNRHILQLNVKLNMATHIRIEDAALSDRNELSSFFLHGGADGTGSLNPNHYGYRYSKTIKVKTRSLDAFDFPRIDLLKIDAEGNELPILKGGANTIQRTRPTLAIEIHQARKARGEHCACETCVYLRSLSYDIDLVGEFTTTPVHWILARSNSAGTES